MIQPLLGLIIQENMCHYWFTANNLKDKANYPKAIMPIFQQQLQKTLQYRQQKMGKAS